MKKAEFVSKAKFPATLVFLPRVIEWLNRNLESFEIERKEKHKIELVIEEVVVNIMRYAYVDEIGSVAITFAKESPKSLKISLEDQGVPFDPLSKPTEFHEMKSLEDRPIGGLGIPIMKVIMDDIVYERKDGKNILILSKSF